MIRTREGKGKGLGGRRRDGSRARTPVGTPSSFHLHTRTLNRPLVGHSHYIHGSVSVIGQPFFVVIANTGVTKGDACLHAINVGCLLTYVNTPIYTHRVRVYPTQLVADLHASSSLGSGRSCFFTRLGHLGLVVSGLRTNRRLFVVLSRVLGNAGSVSGRGNSFSLVGRFVALRTGNVVTARSLLLKALVSLFPSSVHGCHFRTSVASGRLAFSCHLHPNVTRGVGTYFLVGGVKVTITSWSPPRLGSDLAL